MAIRDGSFALFRGPPPRTALGIEGPAKGRSGASNGGQKSKSRKTHIRHFWPNGRWFKDTRNYLFLDPFFVNFWPFFSGIFPVNSLLNVMRQQGAIFLNFLKDRPANDRCKFPFLNALITFGGFHRGGGVVYPNEMGHNWESGKNLGIHVQLEGFGSKPLLWAILCFL